MRYFRLKRNKLNVITHYVEVTAENRAVQNVRFWGKTQNLNMKKKRHTTEKIIRILRKADGQQTVEEVCREFNISEQTF